MLTVETIARVRREHAKGKSVRAIARTLKLSRETVSKYLRSGETAPRYERQVQPYPQLAPFQKDLERLVEENDHQPVRDRLDYLGIFKRLQAAGYQGGYDAALHQSLEAAPASSNASPGVRAADVRAG